MFRREFIETSVLASVFPFELADSEKNGYWDFDGLRDGKLVFVRYDGVGERTASCVIGGEIGSWTVRKAVWGGQVRHSEEFTDRAEALDHAVDWMQVT